MTVDSAPPPQIPQPGRDSSGPPLHSGLSPDALTHPVLMGSLGRLVRGLSLLFWGLPIALVICVQSAKGDWFRPLGILAPIAATGMLLYGVGLLGRFQRQERPWTVALDRARLLAVVNLGLSPFLYWWNRVPSNPFFGGMVEMLMLSGLLFLILLNPLLCRLTAMLPDEALRAETRIFTRFNRQILITVLIVVAAYLIATFIDPSLPDQAVGWWLRISPLPPATNSIIPQLEHNAPLLLLFLLLLPIAMTMALVWKIKEVILASVFGSAL